MAKKIGEKIGLSEKDRVPLLNLLKRYKLLANKNTIQYFSSKQLIDYKIQIYAIKELYCSAYKVGFNANILSYEKIIMKYLKTEKYIKSKEKWRLKEFIDYFIACLQNLLENC